MSLANPIICSFNAGELSSSLYGRVDLQKYFNGCKTLKNFIPLPHGPAQRRAGTRYINEVFGREQVINGDFVSDTGWTQGTGWTIADGVATATAGAKSALCRSSDCIEGREYLVTYTIDSVTAGSVQAYLGGTLLTARSTAGTFTERATFGGDDDCVGFLKADDFAGVIGDFSVMEVNPPAVLISFEFSTVQAYILEFTEKQIRFYKDGGIILDGDDPYTLETPYLEDDLTSLHTTQSADVLYIAHPDYAPRKLLRYGHTDWELTTITFLGSPVKNITGADKTDPVKVYCPQHNFENEDQIAIWDVAGMYEINGFHIVTGRTDDSFKLRGVDGEHFHAYTGGGKTWKIRRPITGATQANPVVITLPNHGFANGDRIRITGVGGMTEINDKNFTVANRTEDTFELQGIDGTGYTAYTIGGYAGIWSELFEEEDHYPSSVEFFEERLIWAATNEKPQTIFGSKVGDYENMGAGPNDDDAFIYTIAAKGVNPIQWIVPMDKLLLGTRGGEWVMRSSGADEPITPSNVNIKRESTWGSANVQALLVNDVVLFLQRGRSKIRELVYNFEKDGYVAPDLTILSEHITTGGIQRIAYQQEPYSFLWAVRKDGVLLNMVYERSQNVVGWSRQVTDGKVKDVAVITSSGDDEVWLLVERTINGSPRLYMERSEDQYLDSYLTWSGGGPVAITGITNASQAVVIAPGNYCDNGDHVRIVNVEGMTEVNECVFTVSDKSGDTFKIKDSDGNYVNSSDFGTYTSGGTAEVVSIDFSGVEHLAGESIHLLGDGCVLPAVTVSATGTFSLSAYVGELVAGLQFDSVLQPMNIEAGAQAGTAQGKIKRVHELTIRLKDTKACWVKAADDTWQEIAFRGDEDPADAPIPAFTGDKRVCVYPGSFGTEGDITLMVKEPYPATIVALLPKLKTMDVL